jgi:hypothetical protein
VRVSSREGVRVSARVRVSAHKGEGELEGEGEVSASARAKRPVATGGNWSLSVLWE